MPHASSKKAAAIAASDDESADENASALTSQELLARITDPASLRVCAYLAKCIEETVAGLGQAIHKDVNTFVAQASLDVEVRKDVEQISIETVYEQVQRIYATVCAKSGAGASAKKTVAVTTWFRNEYATNESLQKEFPASKDIRASVKKNKGSPEWLMGVATAVYKALSDADKKKVKVWREQHATVDEVLEKPADADDGSDGSGDDSDLESEPESGSGSDSDDDTPVPPKKTPKKVPKKKDAKGKSHH